MATPPTVGATAPDIALTDPQTGETRHLSDYRGKDVILVFFRGTWCPLCRDQMTVLSENHERLAKAGIVLLGVICENPVTVRHYLKNNPLPFPLFLDGSRAAAKAMGCHYWLTYEGFNLSHPALFILDQYGVITFSHIGRNMSDLPVTTVLEKFFGFLNETPEITAD
jgi:peroxiredoxin Q/BCP